MYHGPFHEIKEVFDMSTEEEKIRKYALKTKIKNYDRYCLRFDEACGFYELFQSDPFDAICLAFDFGMAKGYRARKREEMQHG